METKPRNVDRNEVERQTYLSSEPPKSNGGGDRRVWRVRRYGLSPND